MGDIVVTRAMRGQSAATCRNETPRLFERKAVREQAEAGLGTWPQGKRFSRRRCRSIPWRRASRLFSNRFSMTTVLPLTSSVT